MSIAIWVCNRAESADVTGQPSILRAHTFRPTPINHHLSAHGRHRSRCGAGTAAALLLLLSAGICIRRLGCVVAQQRGRQRAVHPGAAARGREHGATVAGEAHPSVPGCKAARRVESPSVPDPHLAHHCRTCQEQSALSRQRAMQGCNVVKTHGEVHSFVHDAPRWSGRRSAPRLVSRCGWMRPLQGRSWCWAAVERCCLAQALHVAPRWREHRLKAAH